MRQTGGRGQYGVVELEVEPLRARHRLPVREQDRRRLGAEGVRRPDRGRASRTRWRAAPSAATRWSTCASRWSTAPPTRSTRRRWRSGWPASRACARRWSTADPVMLEPIMKVEVRTPEQFFGDVLGDINARRGQVLDVETFGTLQIIRGADPAGGDVRLHDGPALDDARAAPATRWSSTTTRSARARGGEARRARQGAPLVALGRREEEADATTEDPDQAQGLRPPHPRPVCRADRRGGGAHRRVRRRPGAAADRDQEVHA